MSEAFLNMDRFNQLLHGAGACLGEGQIAEATKLLEELIELLKVTYGDQLESQGEMYGFAIYGLADCYLKQEMWAKHLATLEESASMYTILAKRNPEQFSDKVPGILVELAIGFTAFRIYDEAIEAYSAAVLSVDCIPGLELATVNRTKAYIMGSWADLLESLELFEDAAQLRETIQRIRREFGEQ